MLPTLPLVVSSTKESSKIPDVEDVAVTCESSGKSPASNIVSAKMVGIKSNVQSDVASQLVLGHTDKNEERPSDKLLRSIAPKPVAIICMPDIPNVHETEIEVTEKQEIISKGGEETNKTLTTGCITKCEKDNEEESLMLKKNNTTGRSPPKIIKKKPKQIRDLEKTLNCLLSDNEQVRDEKAFAFAQSYFLKVTETLHGKDDSTYSEFMKTMNDFGVTIFDATELYKKVTKIFEQYPSLSEEFLAFLLPEQAMQCGKFMEYIMITKMRSFCRKLELYYSKQPSQLRKIYSSLASLASNNKATLDDLKNTILPLLKNNSLLVNMFLELIPTEAPHASSFTDYESMDFTGIDIQNPKPEDWFETVEVPPPVEDNMYGGEDCICPCHIPPEGKTRRRSAHCISCGTKFIQGRVYIHSGSMLRPARVSFKEMKTKAIERLSVKNLKTRRKIDKNQAPLSSSKKNHSAKVEMSSTNVSGISNKMSPPKTKKTTKAKSLNENQKKCSKTLSPSKVSHEKQLSNDRKMSKPTRKGIKLLTNNPEVPSTSSVKSHLASSKKGVPQTGKLSCKIEAKASNKDLPQIPIHQTETTRRAARSNTRNVTLEKDNNQKPNRKHIVNSGKGDDVSPVTTDMIPKKCQEQISLKNKNFSLVTPCEASDNQGSHGKQPSESNSLIGKTVVESPTEENNCITVLDVKNIDVKNDSGTSSFCNKHFKLYPLSIDGLNSSEKEYISDPSGATDKHESNENPLFVDQSDKKTEFENGIKNTFCEDERKVCSQDTPVQNKSSLHCSYTSSDDSSDQVIDIIVPEGVPEVLSQCEGNLSQSEGDDIKSDVIELENSFENVSSEDEKNILDSEDFPFNSSSDSDIDDNFQMDIEDTCEEMEEWSSTFQNNVDIGIVKEESNSGDEANERPVDTPWTRDEDKIILRTFQSVNNSDHVFKRICNELPSRTAEEVRCRFQTLMSFLQKMAGD